MTKKEFKEAMLRGLGRCVIAVRQDPEKYRDLVLWACKRNFAYDAQSEGTRSWYTYTMANAYPDKETFINTAAEALKKYRPNGSWDLLHLSEVLMFFAMDGYKSARQALEEKYQEILAAMFALKRRPNRIFHELSDLEQLGLTLAVDRTSFLRIAKDFGRLYQEKKYMCDGDFAWFYSSKGGQYRKTMEAAARKDKNIACFIKREQADIDAQEEHQKHILVSDCLGGLPERQTRKPWNGTHLRTGNKSNRNCVQRHCLRFLAAHIPTIHSQLLKIPNRNARNYKMQRGERWRISGILLCVHLR